MAMYPSPLAPQIRSREIDDFVGSPIHHSFHHVESEAFCHLQRNCWRHRKLGTVNHGVDQNGSVMREGSSDSILDLGGVFDPNAANTDRFGHCREIRILELGPKIEEARGLLFKLDEAECAVVEHHDLGRKAMLHERQQVAHQHGEAPVVDRHRR
jgi:hypothetical protein